MKFAVSINGKKYPVTVMREPNNTSALSNFKYEGKTYRGLPEQFNGLRFDKAKEKYVATSIVVTEQIKPVYDTVQAEVEDEPVIEAHETTTEEIVEAIETETEEEPEPELTEEETDPFEPVEQEQEQSKEEEQDLEEDKELKERKLEFLEAVLQESKALEEKTRKTLGKINGANGFKRQNFQPRWDSLFPSAPSFGEGTFEKHKQIWIKAHGSEHLQMTHQMQMKCDSLYIHERASKEFEGWTIDSLLVYYEIDSPDFGVLTFIKNYKQLVRDVLHQYHSKILLATTEQNPDEENPLVVIADYLGHADLSIPLVNLVEKYGDKC
jgi:hypothetical protein